MSIETDLKRFNENLIAEYRATGGQVAGQFAGAPLLLLTTTGARSGQPRTSPLVYTTDGDRIVVIASKGGAPTDPDWYRNVVAHPEVTVELGGERFRARASVAEGEERERLYAQQAARMPNFAEYRKMTDRSIPVVLLQRLG